MNNERVINKEYLKKCGYLEENCEQIERDRDITRCNRTVNIIIGDGYG